jgi:hypothetical protein
LCRLPYAGAILNFEIWLVKLTPGVNFPNILRAAFSYKRFFCAALMCLQFGFVNFWRKDFGAKAAHKMLAKLTPGANVIKQIPRLFTAISD